jgi:hypothetical protein
MSSAPSNTERLSPIGVWSIMVSIRHPSFEKNPNLSVGVFNADDNRIHQPDFTDKSPVPVSNSSHGDVNE